MILKRISSIWIFVHPYDSYNPKDIYIRVAYIQIIPKYGGNKYEL